MRQDIFNFIVIRKYPSNDPEKSVLECLCIVLTINKINISRIFLSACNVKINYEMFSDNYTRKSFTRRLIHIIFFMSKLITRVSIPKKIIMHAFSGYRYTITW